MEAYVHVYAVMRHDAYVRSDDVRNAVTIVAVVPTVQDAQYEVARLTEVNSGKDVVYYWLSARWYPEGRDSGGAR